jgi:hypothetical protein
MGWSEVKSSQLKVMAAGIGASAVVAAGALTIIMSGAPAGTGTVGTVGQGPEVTLGETVTTTTPPSKPETSIATPPVTATTPSGFATP